MRKTPFLATLFLVGCLHAGQTRPPAAAPERLTVTQQLSALLTPAKVQVTPSAFSSTESQGTRELRVNWTASAAAAANAGSPAAGNFSVSSQRQYAESSPRPRSVEVAPGRIFIAAIDRMSQLKSWTIMADPRVLRSEGPGPGGTLTGQVVTLDKAEFFVSIPDDPQITELRIFEPRLSGQEYTLVLVGSIPVSR